MKWSRRRLLEVLAGGSLATAFETAGTAASQRRAAPKAGSVVKTKLRIALMQIETAPDVQDNYRRALQMAQEAGREKPDLMVFPELFAMGYRPEGMGPYAQKLSGEAVRQFLAVAREVGSHIVFGLPLSVGRGTYDSLVLLGPIGLVGVYHKTHLYYDPHDPKSNEQELFLPGQRLGNFNTPLGPLGLFICHDGLYPEVPRCLTLNGADLLVWSINDGAPMQWALHHVYYNLIPLVAVNRVIKDEKTGKLEARGGGSVLLAADGTVVCQSREPREEFLLGEVDLALGRKLRLEGEGMQAFFRVRRPDLYGPIVRPKARHDMVA